MEQTSNDLLAEITPPSVRLFNEFSKPFASA
jgi:hypothetical protein